MPARVHGLARARWEDNGNVARCPKMPGETKYAGNYENVPTVRELGPSFRTVETIPGARE